MGFGERLKSKVGDADRRSDGGKSSACDVATGETGEIDGSDGGMPTTLRVFRGVRNTFNQEHPSLHEG